MCYEDQRGVTEVICDAWMILILCFFPSKYDTSVGCIRIHMYYSTDMQPSIYIHIHIFLIRLPSCHTKKIVAATFNENVQVLDELQEKYRYSFLLRDRNDEVNRVLRGNFVYPFTLYYLKCLGPIASSAILL